MEESKEWLVTDDWKLARGTIEEARHNLTHLQHSLTPAYYLEGELVHYLDVLWPQCKYDQTFTRMDRLINEISEQVIENCVDRKLIKDIKVDDRRHIKKFARKLQHFYQGRKIFNCPVCEHRYSKGFLWRAGCKILTVCLTKHPESRMSENEEQCHARYNKTDYFEHLSNRENCIYHKLVLKFEAL